MKVSSTKTVFFVNFSQRYTLTGLLARQQGIKPVKNARARQEIEEALKYKDEQVQARIKENIKPESIQKEGKEAPKTKAVGLKKPQVLLSSVTTPEDFWSASLFLRMDQKSELDMVIVNLIDFFETPVPGDFNQQVESLTLYSTEIKEANVAIFLLYDQDMESTVDFNSIWISIKTQVRKDASRQNLQKLKEKFAKKFKVPLRPVEIDAENPSEIAEQRAEETPKDNADKLESDASDNDEVKKQEPNPSENVQDKEENLTQGIRVEDLETGMIPQPTKNDSAPVPQPLNTNSLPFNPFDEDDEWETVGKKKKKDVNKMEEMESQMEEKGNLKEEDRHPPREFQQKSKPKNYIYWNQVNKLRKSEKDEGTVFDFLREAIEVRDDFLNTEWLMEPSKTEKEKNRDWKPYLMSKDRYNENFARVLKESLLYSESYYDSETKKQMFVTKERSFVPFKLEESLWFLEVPKEVFEFFMRFDKIRSSILYGMRFRELTQNISIQIEESGDFPLISNPLQAFIQGYFTTGREVFNLWLDILGHFYDRRVRREVDFEFVTRPLFYFLFDILGGRYADGFMETLISERTDPVTIADYYEFMELPILCCSRKDMFIEIIVDNLYNGYPKQKLIFFERILIQSGNFKDRDSIEPSTYELFINQTDIGLNDRQGVIARLVQLGEKRNLPHFITFIVESLDSNPPFANFIFKCLNGLEEFAFKPDMLRDGLKSKLRNNNIVKRLLVGIHNAKILDKPGLGDVLSPRNYFYALYCEIMKAIDPQMVDDDLTIEIIQDRQFMDDSAIRSYLNQFVHNFSSMQDRKRETIEYLDYELERSNRILRENELFLKQFDYFQTTTDALKTLRDNFKRMTINEVRNDPRYKTLIFMHDTFWSRLKDYVEFDVCRQEVVEVAKKCKTIDQLLSEFKAYVFRTNEKFKTFADPRQYTMSQYKRYFKRATHPIDKAKYEKALSSFEFTRSEVNLIMVNSMKLSALRKILELTKDILTIKDFEFMKLQEDQKTQGMTKLHALWSKTPDDQIILSNVIASTPEADSLLSDPFIQTLPNCLKAMASMPKTLLFAKNNKDELIRRMRDDCNSEDSELINRLEAINRYLKPILQLKEGDSIMVVLLHVHKLEKKAQQEIINFAKDVEVMNEHIKIVFQKAQRDTQFTNELVRRMMQRSTLIIEYNKFKQDFEARSEIRNDIRTEKNDAVELRELFNLFKMVVSGSTDRDNLEGMDAERRVYHEFVKLGAAIEILLETIRKLKATGVMDITFNQTLATILGEISRGILSTEEQGKVLAISISSQAQSLSIIEGVNEKLKIMEKSVVDALNSCYSQWSIMNYFAGRKFYYLTLLLDGLLTDAERQENIMVVGEAINDPEFKILVEKREKHHLPNNLEEKVKTIFRIMHDGIGHKILQKIPSSHERKVKIFPTAGNSVKILSSDCSTSKKPMNDYETILKLLVSAKAPMLSLSQLFFCGLNMNSFELIAFLHRAIRDPYQRLYFMVAADSLTETHIIELRKTVEGIYGTCKSINPNLIILLKSPKLLTEVLKSDNFIKCDTDYKKLEESAEKVTSQKLAEQFKDTFVMNQIVLSEMAGMGKTEFIKYEAEKQKCKLVDLFLSGEVNEATLVNRLNNLLKDLDTKQDLAICIKIDFIDNFEVYSKLVDYALFYFCFLKKIPTEKGCIVLGANLKRIYIEIGNTYMNELLSGSQVLQLLCSEEIEKSLGGHRMVSRGRFFKVQDIFYVNDPQSDPQIALKFLQQLKSRSIRESRLDVRTVLGEQEFKRAIEDFFLRGDATKNPDTVTYAQYQLWVKMVALLARQMDQCSEIWPVNLTKDKIDLREEIALEIRYFTSYMSTYSVEQARSSQNEMKSIVNSMQTTNQIGLESMENYKKRFEDIKPWNCKDFIIPMFRGTEYIIALHDIEMLNNSKDGFRYQKRRCLGYTIEAERWYSDNDPKYDKKVTKEVMFTRIFAKFLGEEFAIVESRIKNFKNSESFSISMDNFMKICLMIIKSRIGSPIIIMGESGCGKTYLTQFVSECLLDEKLMVKTLYSGVTEIELLTFINDCIQEALKIAPKRLWVFFDEFNTTCLQSLISEVMIDRTCSVNAEGALKIPENMVFVAACNPYRLKVKQANFGLVPKNIDSILSHRVYPIPERLLNYVWDYGQLSSEDEASYIRLMIKNANLFDKKNEGILENFSNTIINCHKFIRDKEERSAVSLRDIKRVIKVYKWFVEKYNFIRENFPMDKKAKDSIQDRNLIIRSLTAAIMLCYGLRLNGKPEQKDFITTLEKSINKNTLMNKVLTQAIVDNLCNFVDTYVFNELKAIPGIIPEDIAPNRPLKENFIAMLVGYDLLLPMIVCGSPGTSKTLCTQILVNALSLEVTQKRPEDPTPKFIKEFKAMNSMYYGGSETSTDDGIKKVFARGTRYLDGRGTDRPTVIFDEIGLAELSPHNPLKILHPLLERPESGIAFLGMSNWTLDLSKMNRLIYVARPDLTLDDLSNIFTKSIEGYPEGKSKENLKSLLRVLAETYYEFRVWQKKYGLHKEFHGSRDMYAVSKFIYQRVKAHNEIREDEVEGLIKKAIERNFNGAMYAFSYGATNGQISIETVPGLKREPIADKLENLIFSDLDTMEGIDLLCAGEVPIFQRAVYLSSSAVFKRFFLHHLEKSTYKINLDREKFLTETHSMDLLEQNIREDGSRFLLLKTEGDLVDSIIMERLKKIYKDSTKYQGKIIDWRGAKNREKSIELLSTLKNYINLGYIVIMKNLDELYGSLYDLFNQKYTTSGDQKMCFLYYGESKQRVTVHPNFKCIVILSDNKDEKELEITQPAPFLNRFEKFYIRLSNLLSKDKIEKIVALRKRSLEVVKGNKCTLIGSSVELITSLCLTKDELGESRGMQEGETIELGEIGTIQVSDYQLSRLLQLSTTEIFLGQNTLSNKQAKRIITAHKWSSLKQVLDDMSVNPFSRLCLFTFSNAQTLRELQPTIKDRSFVTSEELNDKGADGRLKYFQSMRGDLLIQITDTVHLDMLPQIKDVINISETINSILIVIHLDRDGTKNRGMARISAVNFWNEWDNYTLDDLKDCDYDLIYNALNSSLSHLIADDTNRIALKIVQDGFVSLAQQLVRDSRDENSADNIDHLRKFFRSPDSTSFISKIIQQIPKSGEFIKGCKELILKKSSASDVCRDIPHAISTLFQRLISTFLYPALCSLNVHLNGLSSYAKGLQNPDLHSLFYDSLVQKVSTWVYQDVKDEQIEDARYLEVPFLVDFYDKLYRQVNDMKENLADLIKQLKEEELQMFKENDATEQNIIKGRIQNGQAIFLEKLKAGCTSLVQLLSHFEDRGVKLTEASYNTLLFDLLKKCLAYELAPYVLVYRKFSPLASLLKVSVSDYTLENCFFAGVYMAFLFKEDLKALNDQLCKSRMSIESIFTEEEVHMYSRAHLQIKSGVLFSTLSTLMIANQILNDSAEAVHSTFAATNQATLPKSQSLISSLRRIMLLKTKLGEDAEQAVAVEMRKAQETLKQVGHRVFTQELTSKMPLIMAKVKLTKIKPEEREKRIVILSDYVYLSALEGDIDFFESVHSDKLFTELTTEELEKLCNSIVSALILAYRPLLVEKITQDLRRLDDAINKTGDGDKLSKIMKAIVEGRKSGRSRFMVFLIQLLDKIVISSQNTKQFSSEEVITAVQYVMTNFDSTNRENVLSLKNLLLLAVVRVSFNKIFMDQLPNFKAFERLNHALGNMPAPEQALIEAGIYPKIYFLQSLMLYQQDYRRFVDKFQVLMGYLQMMSRDDSTKKVAFFDEQVMQAYNSHLSTFEQDIYASDLSRIKSALRSPTKGSVELSYYVGGCVLINKFVFKPASGQQELVDTARRIYLEKVADFGVPQHIQVLYRAIIKADLFDFTSFMAESASDRDFVLSLAKLFYQYVTITTCFKSHFRYDQEQYAQPNPPANIKVQGFFCNLISTRELLNKCSVLSQIISIRLNEIGYTTGEGQTVNGLLGSYHCSCGYWYQIANCGRPYAVGVCPWCRQQTGGAGHVLIQRAGHAEIPTFSALSAGILNNYDQSDQRYYGHTILSPDDSDYKQVHLREYNAAQLAAQRNNQEFNRALGIKYCYLHMFDHMFLATSSEMMNEQQKANFLRAAEGSIDLERPELRVMANRPIRNIQEYFLAHVKYDIENLRRELRLRSTVEIFDWLRGSFSKLAESLAELPTDRQATHTNLKPKPEWVENPQQLLNEQEAASRKMNSAEESGAKAFLGLIVNKRIQPSMLNTLQNEYKSSVGTLYRLMRHNFIDDQDVRAEFDKSWASSNCELLKKVVKYQGMLGDYYRILQANFKLVRHIGRQYNRRFTFDEAAETSLESLQDPELESLFEEFCTVWRSLIPQYEAKHPEVFSFAFMCQANLNVSDWIAKILEEGLKTKMVKFLFVDHTMGKEFLYIKAIIRTLVKEVHNKLVELAHKVLKDDETLQAINLEHCSRSKLVEPVDFMRYVHENYYFCSEMHKETTLVFDLKKIEYLCALTILRPIILIEDIHIKYYDFKNSNLTGLDQTLQKLLKMLPDGDELEHKLSVEISKLNQIEVEEALNFISEVADHIFLNFLYRNPTDKLFQHLPPGKTDPTDLHLAKLPLSSLKQLYKKLNDRLVLLNHGGNCEDLTETQKSMLESLPLEQLQGLVDEMKDSMSSYRQYINDLMKSEIQEYNCNEAIENPEASAQIGKILFNQLSKIEEILQQTISNTQPDIITEAE